MLFMPFNIQHVNIILNYCWLFFTFDYKGYRWVSPGHSERAELMRCCLEATQPLCGLWKVLLLTHHFMSWVSASQFQSELTTPSSCIAVKRKPFSYSFSYLFLPLERIWTKTYYTLKEKLLNQNGSEHYSNSKRIQACFLRQMVIVSRVSI